MPKWLSDRAIAERVIAAREAADLTRAELAEKLGLTKQGYNHYEQFATPFTVQQLLRLSLILNRPVEWFLGLDTELTTDELQMLGMYRRAKSAGVGEMAYGILEAFTSRLKEQT